MRTGLRAEMELVALGHAVLLHKASSENEGLYPAELSNRPHLAFQAIFQAFSQCPDYAALFDALLKIL